MNIFITGASGIIGKKLLPRIQRAGYQLSMLVRKKEEKEMLENSSIKIYIGDLLNMVSLESATRGVDVVIHLAGITYTNTTRLYYEVNTRGTKNLIMACEKNHVKKFIYISSRAAGAEGGAYAHSKLLAEEEVKKSSIPWIILRPAEVYGAGEKEAISRLMRIVQKMSIIPILGNGQYYLSPVYIDDVIDAIVSSLHSKIFYKTYTIAGPRELTYNELVDVIMTPLGIQKQKVYIPIFLLNIISWIFFIIKKDVFVRDQIPRLLCKKSADIKEATNDLDFHPRSLEEGLKLLMKENG